VEQFGTSRVVEIGGVRIGLTHGHLGRGRTTPERARSLFASEPVDVVVFGHSHQPVWVPRSSLGPAMLNPGSPTDRRREPAWSFGVLEIAEHVNGRIETFHDRTI
jgi:putative phosphoesterase